MNGLVKLAMHAGLATGAGALAAKLGGLRIERAPESERAADRATERLRDSERVGPTGMWASSPEAGHVASGAAGIGAAALATRAFRRTGLARHPLGALVYAAGALGAAVLARDLHRAGRAAAGRQRQSTAPVTGKPRDQRQAALKAAQTKAARGIRPLGRA